MTIARRARVKLTYNNADITAALAPYLKSIQWTDYASGAADDLQVTLEDRAGLWRGSWRPEKGAALRAWITATSWKAAEKEEQLPLGTFEIDEIESSGPPEIVTIKAVSVPNSTALRGQDKTRAWEKTRLSVVANDIASGAKLKLFYETADDPEYDRVEQTEESDLNFLMRLCNDAGLALKITDRQVTVFDEAQYEQTKPVMTIGRKSGLVENYRITSSVRDVYKACRVQYSAASAKEQISYTFTAPNAPATGKTLVVNEAVRNLAEAERLAKKRLRQQNRDEVTVSLTLAGTLALVAGVTVLLSGWGAFDGKYYVTRADHGVGDGYSVGLELRRVLEGY